MTYIKGRIIDWSGLIDKIIKNISLLLYNVKRI